MLLHLEHRVAAALRVADDGKGDPVLGKALRANRAFRPISEIDDELCATEKYRHLRPDLDLLASSRHLSCDGPGATEILGWFLVERHAQPDGIRLGSRSIARSTPKVGYGDLPLRTMILRWRRVHVSQDDRDHYCADYTCEDSRDPFP